MGTSFTRFHGTLIVAALFVGSPAVRADYVTQTITLDQSTVLKDGVNYGSVLIEAYNGVGAPGGGLNAGEVRLTYTANGLPTYVSLDKTFGIDRIAFNTDLSLGAGQISGPSGWKVNSNSTVSSFGKFNWEVQGSAKGGSRPNPVTTLITGLAASATVDHFLFGSVGAGNSPPTDGSVFFAAHVAGFSTGSDAADSSHFLGGSSAVIIDPPGGFGEGPVDTPEPTTLALCGLGFGILGLARAARKYRRKE